MKWTILMRTERTIYYEKKIGIIIGAYILTKITLNNPLTVMWETSGVFEVWSFWLIILILFFYIKTEE